MDTPDVIPVYGRDGFLGVTASKAEPGPPDRTHVKLESGRVALVPTGLLHLQDDGSFRIDLSIAELRPYIAPEAATSAAPAGDEAGRAHDEPRTIPIAEERLRVGKRVVEDERVRITKTVQEREEEIDIPLLSETYDIERVPINEVVEGPAPIREEDGAVIVPVYEEVLVVEKRLILREELRLTRRTEETRDTRRITLRREEANVERQSPPQREAG